MSKKYRQPINNNEPITDLTTANLLWRTPGGLVVGVFIDHKFFSVIEPAIEHLSISGVNDPMGYLKSLDKFPIGSGKIIMDRLNKTVRNDEFTGKKMGMLINCATDWFGDIDYDIV